MSHHSMLVSKPSSHSMPQEEQQVLLSILEMMVQILFHHMKDMHSHMQFKEWTLQVNYAQTGSSKLSENSE